MNIKSYVFQVAQNFTYTYLGTNALDILITFFEMVYKNIHKCKKKKNTIHEQWEESS